MAVSKTTAAKKVAATQRYIDSNDQMHCKAVGLA